MRSWGILLLLFLSVNVAYSFPLTPDPELSPSHKCNRRNPDYLEDRYKERIPYCFRNVSTTLKKEIYNLYNIPEKCRHRYTVDHIIPLALGGDNSVANLWPEHKKVKATRPDLEMELYTALKNGQIKQKEAIQIILTEKFNAQQISDGKTNCDKVTH